MFVLFFSLLGASEASKAQPSSLSNMLRVSANLGTPSQEIELLLDFGAFDSTIFVDGKYGSNCFEFVECFMPSRSKSFLSSSRKVSFFGGNCVLRTGSVATDVLGLPSQDDQSTVLTFTKIDRSDPASSRVPRDAAGYLGLNPRSDFARKNLIVFDSNPDGSYDFSFLAGSKIADMFTDDGPNNSILNARVNEQTIDWVIPALIIPTREAEESSPPLTSHQAIELVIDLNERGIVIHRSIGAAVLEAMFTDKSEYVVQQNILYVDCDMNRGLVGFGIGKRVVEWPVASLWMKQPLERITVDGKNFCKTHVEFTALPPMEGRVKIGKMLMQHVSSLAFSGAEKQIYFQFKVPMMTDGGQWRMTLNHISLPVRTVPTVDWPPIVQEIEDEEGEDVVQLVFQANSVSGGKWCLFNRYPQFLANDMRVTFYRCYPDRSEGLVAGSNYKRTIELPGSDLDIDELFVDLEDVDESQIVFTIPRNEESNSFVQIVETENKMEIILKYMPSVASDLGSTEMECLSDDKACVQADEDDSSGSRVGMKRNVGFREDDLTSIDSGEKRSRRSNVEYDFDFSSS